MGKKLTPEELKELREDVLESKKIEEPKETKIIFDGKQYSIRFPKRFIEEAKVDTTKDIFLLKLIIPEYPEKPRITAELVRK